MMTRSATVSGFARFGDVEARNAFLRDVLDDRPELKQHATLGLTRPEIVFEGLTPSLWRVVRRAINGRGQWFGDEQFETME